MQREAIREHQSSRSIGVGEEGAIQNTLLVSIDSIEELAVTNYALSGTVDLC